MRDSERQLMEGDFAQLFALLDHPVPRVDAIEIITRVRRHRARRSALLAAAALLCAATVATAAVPGTGLNDIVRSLLGGTSTATVRPPRGSSEQVQLPAVPAPPLGIAFVPGDRATITFRADQSSGELYVRVDTTSSIRITATGGHVARYDLTPSGVEIDNVGSTASYELVLPATLAHATVRVSERLIASRERGKLECGERPARGNGCVVVLQR